MTTCLKVIKLALARSAAEDAPARAKQGEIIREHLDSCPGCASFVERLNASGPGETAGRAGDGT